MSTLAARAVAALLVVVLAGLAAGSAAAHVRSSDGSSEIRQDGAGVRYDLSVEYELLAAAAGLGQGEADEALLREHRDAVETNLVPRIEVFLDGVGCEGAVQGTGLEERQGLTYAAIRLGYACAGSASGDYQIRYAVFSPSDAVVDDHTDVADYDLAGHAGTFVFDAGHRELDVGSAGLMSSAGRFVALGVEHILGGIDHVLFLVALLLGAGGFGSVVKLASTFTAAHTVTLGLAAVGWVDVPAEIVEPLIALSIAYVAAENILGGESRHRLLVVFAFGLLHGLGFASTLSFTDELSSRLLASLLTFNVGIEIGQALIIALLFPLLLFTRRYAWSVPARATATVMAGSLGLFWFFERLVA